MGYSSDLPQFGQGPVCGFTRDEAGEHKRDLLGAGYHGVEVLHLVGWPADRYVLRVPVGSARLAWVVTENDVLTLCRANFYLPLLPRVPPPLDGMQRARRRGQLLLAQGLASVTLSGLAGGQN